MPETPRWPGPDVKLFNVRAHVLTETNRQAGHLDIMREQLGSGGVDAVGSDADWEAHRARIDLAARLASGAA